MAPSSQEITQLLQQWSDGDRAALDRLAPLVHDELRRLARGYMKRERPDHTLQATALVNEAYLRLADREGLRLRDRSHFFAVCAQVMRHVLVDYARAHARDKRGGGAVHVSLDETAALAPERAAELLALDEALAALETFDPRKSRIVEMRYFGGLGVDETAEVLGISARTVMREWRRAKAWLYRSIVEGGADDA